MIPFRRERIKDQHAFYRKMPVLSLVPTDQLQSVTWTRCAVPTHATVFQLAISETTYVINHNHWLLRHLILRCAQHKIQMDCSPHPFAQTTAAAYTLSLTVRGLLLPHFEPLSGNNTPHPWSCCVLGREGRISRPPHLFTLPPLLDLRKKHRD